jgi:hypothetical protein
MEKPFMQFAPVSTVFRPAAGKIARAGALRCPFHRKARKHNDKRQEFTFHPSGIIEFWPDCCPMRPA